MTVKVAVIYYSATGNLADRVSGGLARRNP